MIGVVIDIALVAAIVVCAFRGFRNGMIRGLCGFLALVLSLVIANAAASAFAGEFTGALRPFVGGIVDSKVQDILRPDGEEGAAEGTQAVLPDETEYDASTTYGMAMLTLRKLGFLKPVADKISETIERETTKIGYALGEVITDKLSSALAHIAVFAVAFLLLSIVFAVIGNLLNVVFSLPGLRLVDQVAGTAFGLLRGLIIVMFVALIFRYFGMMGSDLVEKTSVLEYFVKHNAIAGVLGI